MLEISCLGGSSHRRYWPLPASSSILYYSTSTVAIFEYSARKYTLASRTLEYGWAREYVYRENNWESGGVGHSCRRRRLCWRLCELRPPISWGPPPIPPTVKNGEISGHTTGNWWIFGVRICRFESEFSNFMIKQYRERSSNLRFRVHFRYDTTTPPPSLFADITTRQHRDLWNTINETH